jgi:hypothetical protein
MVYKSVIKESKKRENDRYIADANNKTEGVWQVINKEIGNNPENEQEMERWSNKNKLTGYS